MHTSSTRLKGFTIVLFCALALMVSAAVFDMRQTTRNRVTAQCADQCPKAYMVHCHGLTCDCVCR